MPFGQPGGTNNGGYGTGGGGMPGGGPSGGGADNWGGGPGQTQSRDPGAAGKPAGSPDAGGDTSKPGGFGGIGTNGKPTSKSPTPAGATVNGPKDFNSMMSGNEDPDVVKDMNDKAVQAQGKYADYANKSFWDHVKGFFGFHEQNPYNADGTVDVGDDPTDMTADVDFDIMRAPIIGIGLGLIPGVGPILGGLYGLASGIYQGNPVAAIAGAVPVLGGLLGPGAAAIANSIGAVGNVVNTGATLAGYGGIDDALGTNVGFSGTGTGNGTNTSTGPGFSGDDKGGKGGDKKGFGTVSQIASNDNAAGSAAPPATQDVSAQQQSSLRSLYGMVSGVNEGQATDGIVPKSSQGFGGRANQAMRTAYRFK